MQTPTQVAVASRRSAPGDRTTAKPRLAGTGGTKEDWLRKKAATEARLGRMIEGTEFLILRRSKRPAEHMHASSVADSDAGQVARSSGHTPHRSQATSSAYDADGVDNTPLPAEVGGNAPHADEFEPPASDESNGESDSDDCLQVHDPSGCEEDDFGANGLCIDKRSRSGQVRSPFTTFSLRQSSLGVLPFLGRCWTRGSTINRPCTGGSCLFGTTSRPTLKSRASAHRCL